MLINGTKDRQGNIQKEAAFSESDYVVSHVNNLATLAVQASRPL